ncbi:hypothetical protein [Olivibacter jilunii]|uniref:hypothetical protein n=1 Tax=Olivibacter jilunii TaxID=985016 RepID=UPI003F143036
MYYTLLVVSIYLGVIALVIYILYRIINGWINRSLNVRREQNELLAKLINVLEKEKSREH